MMKTLYYTAMALMIFASVPARADNRADITAIVNLAQNALTHHDAEGFLATLSAPSRAHLDQWRQLAATTPPGMATTLPSPSAGFALTTLQKPVTPAERKTMTTAQSL
jgi:hypothetical protein